MNITKFIQEEKIELNYGWQLSISDLKRKEVWIAGIFAITISLLTLIFLKNANILFFGIVGVVYHFFDSFFTITVLYRQGTIDAIEYLEQNNLLKKVFKKYGILKGERLFSLYTFPITFIFGVFFGWASQEISIIFLFGYLFLLIITLENVFIWAYLLKYPDKARQNIEVRKKLLLNKKQND